MKIIQKLSYRSKPLVNQDDDMVRLVIDMTKREYRDFDKRLKWDEELKELVCK